MTKHLDLQYYHYLRKKRLLFLVCHLYTFVFQKTFKSQKYVETTRNSVQFINPEQISCW